jgi:hypothetical protein
MAEHEGSLPGWPGPSTATVASRQLVDLAFDRILDDRLGSVV